MSARLIPDEDEWIDVVSAGLIPDKDEWIAVVSAGLIPEQSQFTNIDNDKVCLAHMCDCMVLQMLSRILCNIENEQVS